MKSVGLTPLRKRIGNQPLQRTSLAEGGFLLAKILQNKNNRNRFVIFYEPSAQKRRVLIGKGALNGENFPLLSVKFHLVFSPLPEYYNNCQQGPHLYRGPKKIHCKKKEKLIMKKFAALAVAGCMAVSLAACGASASAPASSEAASTESAATSAAESAAESVAETTQGGKIGVCIYKFDDAFMTTYRNALQEILEGKGYEVTIVDGNNDQAKQNEQINTFITQGVDALIINPVMTSAADQIISTVKGADVPTVLINREPTADQMSAYDKLVYVGCDAAQSGTFQGELILDTENKGDINGDGKVSYIMIQGDPENIDAQLRTEYSVKALTDAGVEVEQLDLQRGDWDRNKGQEICQNDLAKFGDQIEVVFCNNDDMAIGALQAIQAAGRTVNKDIYLVGVDALDAALNEVANGNMTGTVLNDAKGQATQAVASMEELLGGKTFEAEHQSVYVDYVKVTPDNVKDFQ